MLTRIAALAMTLGPPLEPSVTIDLPPPPEAGVGWLQPLAVIVLLASVALLLVQRRRRKKFSDLGGLRSLALGASVGNALLELGAVLTPDRPAAESIQNIEEEPLRDEQGDGRDPSPPPPQAQPSGSGRRST